VSHLPDLLNKLTGRKRLLRSLILLVVLGLTVLWTFAVLFLIVVRFIDPPTTAVHIERRFQAWIHHTPYHLRYRFVPISQISPNLQHAVIAAEDARFYQHHGFDWHQIQIAAEDNMEGGRMRGASTITQQLVKNLLLGTSRSIFRKGAEFTLVPVAEMVQARKEFLNFTSTLSNGDRAFTAQTLHAAPTTELQPEVLAANRRPAWLRYFLLHSSGGPIT
jgi:monofunctional biosynthetic peptidoglycan transglycosylase